MYTSYIYKTSISARWRAPFINCPISTNQKFVVSGGWVVYKPILGRTNLYANIQDHTESYKTTEDYTGLSKWMQKNMVDQIWQ